MQIKINKTQIIEKVAKVDEVAAKVPDKLGISKIGYLRNKFGIMTSEELHSEIKQVKPFYKAGMDNALYRNKMMAYDPTIELNGAFGITNANPQFGVGKLPQIFIENFNELVHNGYLKKIPEKAIELQNFKMPYEDYENILDRIIELCGKGY
ncbi:MAG: hypothetical protein ACI8WT_004603 [Clostridium sp.]